MSPSVCRTRTQLAARQTTTGLRGGVGPLVIFVLVFYPSFMSIFS